MNQITEKLTSIGLNRSQAEVFLFVLKKKRATQSEIADFLGITITGVSKILKVLMEKGFVKSYKFSNRAFYLPCDLAELGDKLVKDLDKSKDNLSSLLRELDSAFGGYSIKSWRVRSEDLPKYTEDLILSTKVVHEFIDRNNSIKKGKNRRYKNIEFNTTYLGEPNSIDGRWLESDSSKNYGHTLVIGDKVIFKTANREAMVLENEEIANQMKLLIRKAANI